MKFFTVFIVVLLLFSSCGEEEKDNSNNKPSSKTAHFYYENFVLRSFSDQNTSVTIKIPECFEKDDYGSYSVNNNWMLKCHDDYSFLTIDYFTKDDIENYFYYYSDEEEGELDDHLEFLLNYIASKRAGNLLDSEISQITSAKNVRNSNFIFQSVTGRETNYKDNLFFLFGAVELDGHYFIIQAISSYNSLKFHLADFKKMILSVNRI